MNGNDLRPREHTDRDFQLAPSYLDNPSPKNSKLAEFVDWILLSSSVGLGFLAIARTFGFHV